MQPIFAHTLFLGPALAANHTYIFKAPFDMQLVHVSAVNTSANAGTLKLGTTSDDDAYLAATNFGVSSAPAEVAAYSAFIGGQFPHVPKGTLFMATITDHASHMAGVSVVLTFSEG